MDIMDKIAFPKYRKYINNKSLFKIISIDEFEELKFTGKTIAIHHFKAKILPDRNFIQDMLFDYEKYWIVCAKKEYENLKKSVISKTYYSS